MRKLLNTLYVLTETAYLSLDGENVIITSGDDTLGRYPLHGFESIVSFSYRGASPALMGACAERNIDLCFMKPNGTFLCRICGRVRGNVLLRKKQFSVQADPKESLVIVKNIVLGKFFNSRWVLERATRDHPLSVDVDRLKKASGRIKDAITRLNDTSDIDQIRGIEGDTAAEYFGVFNELVLNNNTTFAFTRRSRRPPLDPINAMLSFAYSLLENNCAHALESVGLDPYLGFMHSDRPGRRSLALDLMEEFRSVIADRIVLYCVNNRIIQANMFDCGSNGAVTMNDQGRRLFLKEWQERRKDTLTHPFLKEKIPWGLVPFVQALLLARYLRGDLDAYPPFLWK